MMRVARFAVMTTPNEIEGWKDRRLEINGVTVSCVLEKTVGSENAKILVGRATLPFKPKITADRKVVIDNKRRIRIEEAIEHYANLLAFSNFTSRSLSSPNPSVALAPETDEDAALLNEATGIHVAPLTRTVHGSTYQVDLAAYSENLQDRLDGVALIAEALRYQQASGRFRDCIRLFERAFKVANSRLIGPLRPDPVDSDSR